MDTETLIDDLIKAARAQGAAQQDDYAFPSDDQAVNDAKAALLDHIERLRGDLESALYAGDDR